MTLNFSYVNREKSSSGLKGIGRERFDEIRQRKRDEAGGFEENLVLTEIYQDPQSCGLGLCTCKRNDLVFEDD